MNHLSVAIKERQSKCIETKLKVRRRISGRGSTGLLKEGYKVCKDRLDQFSSVVSAKGKGSDRESSETVRLSEKQRSYR